MRTLKSDAGRNKSTWLLGFHVVRGLFLSRENAGLAQLRRTIIKSNTNKRKRESERNRSGRVEQRYREFGKSWRSLCLCQRVQCRASELSTPDCPASALHLTSPLYHCKAPAGAAREAELSFIVVIKSTAIFSSCARLIATNEIMLHSSYRLLYAIDLNPRLYKAFNLHVLISIIEGYVQTQCIHTQRSCRS